jgi:hypothetical protein
LFLSTIAGADFERDQGTSRKCVRDVGFARRESNRARSYPAAPEVVAEVIWQAVTATGDQLRFRAGADAHALLDDRKARNDAAFLGWIKGLMAE